MMRAEQNQSEKYKQTIEMQDYNQRREAAKKKVEEIKSFYGHLRAYIIINVLLILLQTELVDFILARNKDMDPGFFDWVNINIIITPLLWGIGLAFHGLYVYRHKLTFFKKWEERQIRKFMEEDEANQNQFH